MEALDLVPDTLDSDKGTQDVVIVIDREETD